VSEIISVTEEELRRINCLELECLPPEKESEPDEIDPSTAASTGNCEPTQPEFIWCPEDVEDEYGGEEGPHPPATFRGGEGEEEEVGEDYVEQWVQQARIRREYPGEDGEYGGEDEPPLLPAPTPPPLGSATERVEEISPTVIPRPLPPPPRTALSLEEELFRDLEPGMPCRHTFRPEPLYKPWPSGNFVIDQVLPHKTHFTNALFNHHYSLCSKTLGLGTVKKHFKGRVNLEEPVGANSLFHQF